MKKEDLFDQEASEANLKLNEELNDDMTILHEAEGSDSSAEANLKIQEEFNSHRPKEEVFPTYLYNNTPAIRVTRKDK
ncbi:hypothetical protein [Bacillus thermotolerans]|uniref:Uncharacterized protein n=1 Tax=Bacillus thermotolerans TaxID=1221996 RepID=A0A0F5HM19_BACTR|nr:hypothetical protein [Bacillus thermotolerans]KKB34439.1 hypothetical protein QY95_03918 [Bacillus thermotolerans]KKB34614.1 hypothetical protein QY96_03871 [Bacillus thermotolerans]KKB37863.1 hypothetical protein QY97_03768 [Bacillus thermotolerans]